MLGEQTGAFSHTDHHGLPVDDLVLYQRVTVDDFAVFPVVVPQVGLFAELPGEVAAQLVAVAAVELEIGEADYGLVHGCFWFLVWLNRLVKS